MFLIAMAVALGFVSLVGFVSGSVLVAGGANREATDWVSITSFTLLALAFLCVRPTLSGVLTT